MKASMIGGDVQYVSQSTSKYSHVDTIKLAIEGGCRWIQLRMKDEPKEEVLKTALVVQQICRDAGATFIIDDYVDIVKTIHADGVHLGNNDMPIAQARKILGNDFIIGGTANNLNTIISHYHDGADYVGLGPYRFTTTKKNLSKILGIDGVKNISEGMQREGINIPIVVIGGITSNDIADIMKYNMYGIAISGIVANANNPAVEMKKLINEIKKWKN